jgi:dipeptidyl aminopeptidase/acylaminoacyl peptidase
MPAAPSRGGEKRSVTARDLATLRDFGDLGIFATSPIVALAPDQSQAAVILRQGRPDTNDYCTALVILQLNGSKPPKVIGDAGDVVRAPYERYGIYGLRSGVPYVPPVRWSPDGRSIAWVREIRGQSEIWKINPTGDGASLLLRSAVPIETLDWSKDSATLTVSSRPAVLAEEQAIDREGLTGFHYDGRFWPLARMRPYLPSPIPLTVQQIDVRTGAVSIVNGSSSREHDGADRPADAILFARSSSGNATAWTAPPTPGISFEPSVLHARAHGRDLPCRSPQCRDVIGLWWLDDGATLLVLRRTGVARSEVALDRWKVVTGDVQSVLETEDMLFGCQLVGADLLCGHEGSRQPRNLVRIDSRTGTMATVFDPNPEWHDLRLGSIERIVWTNRLGNATFGDLVLPPSAKPGARLPLIIVQYDSRGFLRGGTADDYPIQLFATHGFAVLSFNRPPWYALTQHPKSDAEFEHLNQENWNDRRNYQASIEAAAHLLDARGIIDPARVGITGQSDGSSAATFGLIHSNLFAAAALSTCCEDPNIMSEIGLGFARDYATNGYPLAGVSAPDFWAQNSLDLNTRHHPVPLLIQASDEEARMALSTFTTLKNAGWPIDMFVFPDENHVKFWPAHRLALYERSLAWFERWLTPADPTRSLQPQPAAQASTSAN